MITTDEFTDLLGKPSNSLTTTPLPQEPRLPSRWYDPSVGRWISEDGIGFAGDPSNTYRYVDNSPPNGTDPDGQRTIRQGRYIGGRGPAFRGRGVLSHEFIFTVDPNGNIRTYSWGNDLNDPNCPSHWYRNQPDDRQAAEEALKGDRFILIPTLGPFIGDDDFDPYIEEAFRILHDAGADSPSAHGHGGVALNCKTEATRLTDLAQALQDLDKKYPRKQDREFWREKVKADFGILPNPEVMPPRIPNMNR